MAVTIAETFGRQYTSQATGLRTAVRVYCVLGDQDYTDLIELTAAAVAAGMPDLGDSWDSANASLVVRSHTPIEILKEKRYYHIEVGYETNSLALSSPTSQPWRIRFGSLLEQWVPDMTLGSTIGITQGQEQGVDIAQPILNSAGFPFDPTVTDVRSLMTISLNKKFENITDIGTITDIDELMSYANTVNSAAVTVAGIQADTQMFWMRDISASNEEQNGESFYDVTFELVFDPTLHYKKILDAGYMDANQRKIFGNDGQPLTMPWPLDGAGAPLRGNAAARAANAVYLAFQVKEAVAFAPLGLPTTF